VASLFGTEMILTLWQPGNICTSHWDKYCLLTLKWPGGEW